MDPVMELAVQPCFVRLKNVGAEKTGLPTKKSEKPAANVSKKEKKSDGKYQMKISVFFSPRSKKKEITEVSEEKEEIKKDVGKEKEDPASSDSPPDSTETNRANTPDEAGEKEAPDVDEGLEPNVLIRKANNLDLTKLKTELLSSPSIPDEFKKQPENLLTEYRRFLALKVILGDTSPPLNLSPSAILDSVWHLHLLMPAHYFRCCKQLGEEVIDHDSSTARDHEDIRKKRLEMTKRSYKVAFGEAPPDRFWDLTYQHFTERESTPKKGPAADPRNPRGSKKIMVVCPADDSLQPEKETTHVNFKVRRPDGSETFVKLKRTTKMARLFNCLEKLMQIPEGSYYLIYDAMRVHETDTPNSLKMVDGDAIDMYFRITGC